MLHISIQILLSISISASLYLQLRFSLIFISFHVLPSAFFVKLQECSKNVECLNVYLRITSAQIKIMSAKCLVEFVGANCHNKPAINPQVHSEIDSVHWYNRSLLQALKLTKKCLITAWFWWRVCVIIVVSCHSYAKRLHKSAAVDSEFLLPEILQKIYIKLARKG